MKNIWIQHLEKKKSRDSTQDSSFVEMLHSLAKLDNGYEVSAVKTKPLTRKRRQYSLESIQEELAFDSPDNKDTSSLKENVPVDCETKEDIAEICRWTAKSQRGYEMGSDSFGDDYVQLLHLHDGKFVLRYNVAGEDTFEMEIGSTEEAERLIMEDNLTTSELYPGNPELQWNIK